MMIITVQEPLDIYPFPEPPGPCGPVHMTSRLLVWFENPLESIPSVYPGTVKYSLKQIFNGD